MDNLFTNYELFSTLRSLGIGACGTVRSHRMLGYFAQETLKENNGKLIDWGEIRTKCHYEEGGEMVLFFIWQDQAVVKGMTTVHDCRQYILRPRKRPRDSSTMTTNTRSIFDIPRSESYLTQDLKKYYTSKMALPVTKPIDDYNNNMNSVDRADQLRQDLSIRQTTVRAWLPYWFWILEHTIINAYILWKMEVMKEVIGRANEHLRKQSVFREALITSLLESSPLPNSLDIRVSKYSVLRAVEVDTLPARHHILTGGLKRRQCYFCRYIIVKGGLPVQEIKTTCRGCLIYKLPLYVLCFLVYHTIDKE